ncbi:Integral membrane protein SED5, partial [Spiromyces aspiralis]
MRAATPLIGVRQRNKRESTNLIDDLDSPLYRAKPEVSDGRGENDDFVALSMPDMSDGQAQQMLLLEQQDAYLDSRSEAIKSVETTISELGQIFQQLARMVSEQREVVQR